MAILSFDDVAVDVDGRRATKAGVDLELEPKLFQTLVYLLRNPNRVVRKEELIQQVWSGAANDDALDGAMAQLRKALGDDATPSRYIEIVPAVGYRFLSGVTVAVPPPQADRVSWPRKLLVPIGALFAIGISYLHQGSDDTVQPIPTLRSVQVTSSAGLDSHPTFSSDGASVAYASDRTGSFELFLKVASTDGGKEMQITNDGRQNVEPSWAPDGKQIAYHSVKDRGIFVVPSLGGQSLRITDFGSEPSWAPDSRRIVFRSAPTVSFDRSEIAPSAPSTLWVASISGSAPQPLTKPGQPPGRHSGPVFSHDGKRVLFVSHDSPGHADLWEIEIKTGALTRIETGLPLVYSPRFTPDGSGIFFFGAGSAEKIGLYAMGIDKDSRAIVRKAERLMEFDSAVPRDLAIGPQTRRLAYTLITSAVSSRVWTEKDGEQAPKVPESSHMRPDSAFHQGRQAVFHRGNQDHFNVWKMDLNTKKETQVTDDAEAAGYPVWSPDGARLAVMLRRGADTHVGLVPAAGGAVVPLTNRPGQAWPGGWSPDGKKIAISALWDGVWNIHKVDAAGGDVQPVTRNSLLRVSVHSPAWLPKGQGIEFKRTETRGNIFVAEPAADGVKNR